MVSYLPSALAVNVLTIAALDFVGHDGDVVRFGTQHDLNQRFDDGDHARGEDHDGHVVFLGPLVEGLEARVELHVRLQDLDALVEGGVDTFQHLSEHVTAVESDQSGLIQ